MTGALFILRMGIGPGRDPPPIPDRRALRREIERQIETLLAVLDDMDGDPDTEDGCHSACKFDPVAGGIGVQN